MNKHKMKKSKGGVDLSIMAHTHSLISLPIRSLKLLRMPFISYVTPHVISAAMSTLLMPRPFPYPRCPRLSTRLNSLSRSLNTLPPPRCQLHASPSPLMR